jgi:hypothetical protein
MRRCLVLVVVSVALLLPTIGNAQTDKFPEPAPQVTAANVDWQIRGEPIFYASNFYWPTGPTIFFDGRVMVRTGQYEGIPLYADPFLQPYSVVYVPVGGNVIRPYIRRQPGAGTINVVAPTAYPPISEPVVIAESSAAPRAVGTAGVAAPRPVGTGGTVVTRATDRDDSVRIERPRQQRSIARPMPEPRVKNGIWLMFNGARYYSSGPAVSYSPDRFTPIGAYRGLPVYGEKSRPTDEIFVPVVEDGPLAPYRR